MRGYKTFFGITGSPFKPHLPPGALLRHSQFEELAAYLDYIADEGSIGLVTGEIGVGKSTAIGSFLPTLDDTRYHVCSIRNADSTRSIFRQKAWSFGMRAAHLLGDVRDEVHRRIGVLWNEHTKRTVLVVDEAQCLSAKALQELRLLTNFPGDTEPPLSLVLVGQPDLRAQIKLIPNEALNQRIMIRYHLAGLSLAETRAYVAAHLTAAGAKADVFSPEAIALIFQSTQGLPRQINKVAIQSLIKAGHQEVNPIDASFVAAVLQKMDQE